MNSNDSFRRAGERIEKLLDELRAMAEPSTWPRVEELMRLVVELYGPGLTRFVELLDTDLTIDKLRERVLGDELLASLMLLHGLHPEDTAARVARALDRVRPYLGSHGGDVTVVGVDERAGVVKLRLDGTCDGCPSSALTVKLTVESAIRELAPEIARIEVEGISERENPLNSMIAKSHVDGANGNGSAAVSREQTKLAGDVCELCSIALSEKHSHLVDMESRNLVCSCRACYLLFTAEVAAQGRYRAVPDRYLHDSSFALTQSAWDAFQIPVRIAFFFHNSLIGRIVALYPGPAGATESMLDLRA